MPHRRAAAVVRFSSLGDVLLAAHVPGFLREADPSRRVLFLTKARHAEILHGHPDIDRLYALEDGSRCSGFSPGAGVRGSLGDLIAALRQDGVAEIFDLHQNLRSSRVLSAFPEAKRRLPKKHGLNRRLMVYARWLRPAPVPPLLRTYRLLCGLDPDGLSIPWLRRSLSTGELERGLDRAAEAVRSGEFVLLAAGARWETKRWPASHFVRLAGEIERRIGIRALYAASPGERAEAELKVLLPSGGRGALLSLPFRELAAVAAHARAIVSNDSAALHLGAALGVPSVGLFGGTVPEFGFARQSPHDEVAEISLWCRPCSVHGRSRCPLGHHACMRRLDPERAIEALERALAHPGAPTAAQASRS